MVGRVLGWWVMWPRLVPVQKTIPFRPDPKMIPPRPCTHAPYHLCSEVTDEMSHDAAILVNVILNTRYFADVSRHVEPWIKRWVSRCRDRLRERKQEEGGDAVELS